MMATERISDLNARTSDLLFPGHAESDTPAAQELEQLLFPTDEDSVLPRQVDIELVRRAFAETYFRGIGNIIDPTAFQTGIRDLKLSDDRRIFEFEMWYDAEGKTRKRVLRIEIVDGEVVSKHDFELDKEGRFYVAEGANEDETSEGESRDGTEWGSVDSRNFVGYNTADEGPDEAG